MSKFAKYCIGVYAFMFLMYGLQFYFYLKGNMKMLLNLNLIMLGCIVFGIYRALRWLYE